MIDFVVASAVRSDAVFAINLTSDFLRNIAHLFRVSRYTEILRCDVECVAWR